MTVKADTYFKSYTKNQVTLFDLESLGNIYVLVINGNIYLKVVEKFGK